MKDKFQHMTYARTDRDHKCPRCQDRREKDIIARDKAIADGYNTMDPDEWIQFRKDSELRFDYGHLAQHVSYGLNLKGEFLITYECHCDQCAFAFSAKYEQTVPFLEHEGIMGDNI